MNIEQITLAINSAFKKEGFDKADQAVSGLGGAVGPLANKFGTLTNAINNLGDGNTGAFGTALKGVNALATGLQQFGVAGAIVGGVQFLIDQIGNHYKDAADEALRKTQEWAREVETASRDMATAISSGVVSSVRDANNEITSSTRSLLGLAAAANAINAAMGKRDAALGTSDIVQLKLEVLNNVIGAENQSAAELAQAEGNLQIALAERANSAKEHERNINTAETSAKQAVDEHALAEKNLSRASKALADARDEAERLEVPALNDREMYGRQYDDALRAVADAEKMVQTAEENLQRASTRVTTTRLDVETATINAKNAETQHTIAVTSASNALDNLRQKQIENANNERIASQKKQLADQTQAQIEEAQNTAQIERNYIRDRYETQRATAMHELQMAEEASAQWERDKVEAQKIHYTDIQKRNLDNVDRIYNESKNAISDRQKNELQAYKDWLQYQSANPNTIIIQNLKAQLSAIDTAEKDDLTALDKNTKDTVEQIKETNRLLTDALTVS